ncbi:fumarylacetoacetate hydrolase family protein [Lapidilactobacillus wuchangensis]|uniref:fumarylacetoacetate hydrolase family protein n=1 Tax=Lapidilactobacillus wuchangensis TaxID=2486001 RepID=UPI000F78A3DC|nr:fumarylacetoacetate hydrolase family protein [Lapidilactobacillus wuchangensis]
MKLAMYQNQPILIQDQQYRPILNETNVQALLLQLDQPLNLGSVQPLPDLRELQAPITAPQQIFAVGFNYRQHLTELATQAPQSPNVFTKFPSSLTGPAPTVQIPSPKTDWETELVIVIGAGGRQISTAAAMNHVAGYMVGQDLSDRQLQFANDKPQFSLAKSYANFAPTGPWLTTADEVDHLGDLILTTTVNGVEKQHSQLKNLIFGVADLVSYLSTIVALVPGDLIFTGTPGGVGAGRSPQEFLQSGDQLISQITQLGKLTIDLK